jgi:probable HAF family extracellular repeat protein
MGQVVGFAYTASETPHAFLWQDDGMIDLNESLPPGSGWELTEARAINDSGQIVGYGIINGETHAFLLHPVACGCDCHADPQCDGVTNVLDVVQSVKVAFRGLPDIVDPNAACPNATSDTNCDGVTNVLDVVHLVNVAFRSADPAVEFCDPCSH